MGELATGTDAELRVDARERPLDRALREVEDGGHLFVRPAFGDELRDALLGRCELAARWRAPADAPQLRQNALRPESCSELRESTQRLFERLPRIPPLTRAPLGRAEREERTRPFEWKRKRFELR